MKMLKGFMDIPGVISATRLRLLLDYNAETGLFHWKIKPAKHILIGTVAGSVRGKGYWYITINKRNYLAHRLAFLWVTSKWPERETDHIDGNRTNNKWINLRQCTSAQNNQNRPKLSVNTSGHKGVFWDKSVAKWRAAIRVDGTKLWLGSFATLAEAVTAYEIAAHKYHGEFTNLK